MKPNPASTAIRIEPLSRRHRIAHLRALIRHWPVQSIQHQQLATLLHDEMMLGQRKPAAWTIPSS
jgi:hypothetical protein